MKGHTPSTILASRWVPTRQRVLLLGNHLAIDSFYTLLRFNPDDDIEPLSKFGFGNFMWCTIELSPNPTVQEINIILDTNGEFAVAHDMPLLIKMLPWILDEEHRAK